MHKNCTTCHWRGEARTPQLATNPQYAGSCEYPLPNLCFVAIEVAGHDALRHINMATYTETSPLFNAYHAKLRCTTWKEKEEEVEEVVDAEIEQMLDKAGIER